MSSWAANGVKSMDADVGAILKVFVEGEGILITYAEVKELLEYEEALEEEFARGEVVIVEGHVESSLEAGDVKEIIAGEGTKQPCAPNKASGGSSAKGSLPNKPEDQYLKDIEARRFAEDKIMMEADIRADDPLAESKKVRDKLVKKVIAEAAEVERMIAAGNLIQAKEVFKRLEQLFSCMKTGHLAIF